MDEECCATCRFWRDYGNDPDRGYCRRYPPTVIEEDRSDLPETGKQFWCGEFKPKERDNGG